MVQAQCIITCAFVDVCGYPALGLDAKTQLKMPPRGAFLEYGLRRAQPGCSARAPAAGRRCPHTNALVRVYCRATLRRATRATKVAAPPPRTHTRPRRRRDITPTTAQEGDGIYTRTNGAGLASLEAGATVSVVGRLTGDSSIETSDGVQINLVEPSEAAQTMMPASGCVEVVGTVRDTGSVSPLRVAAFGDDFDLKNYDDLVGLAGDKYAALFR